MSVEAGQELSVLIEKPAAGGRMIARHDGQVLLVSNAIPGEQVRARVERVEKRLAFASTVAVLEPSADRREASGDSLCGGMLYSHIRYERQLALKSDVVADAFTRIGRLTPGAPVTVVAAAERGYRMRARLHVRGARAGFFREGTHDLCDAAATGQLRDDAIAAVAAAVASFADDGTPVVTVEYAENIDATERALHADLGFGTRASVPALARAASAAGLNGCTARTAGGALVAAGDPNISDSFSVLTAGRAPAGVLLRRPESFFQANRYLLPALVCDVLDAVPDEGRVLDLYAGVGLFSLSLAACGRGDIVAVEGHPSSGADLTRNAGAFGDSVQVVIDSVEGYMEGSASPDAGTLVVDPPRTGISKPAMEAVLRYGARRVVYVSCDAPTMARDARRLVDAGYRLTSLRAFDLFPNTPHVETVGVFDRG